MLETTQPIGADVLDEFLMLVEEIGDGLKFGTEMQAVPLELQVGETELRTIVPGHDFSCCLRFLSAYSM